MCVHLWVGVCVGVSVCKGQGSWCVCVCVHMRICAWGVCTQVHSTKGGGLIHHGERLGGGGEVERSGSVTARG